MASPPTSSGAAPPGPSGHDLAAWMAAYGPGLRAFFVKKIGADEAEDLVQEVFVCLNSRAVAAEVDDVERYLFKIAHNVLASHRRRFNARGWRFKASLDALSDPVDEISPERVLLAKLDYERAIVAVRKLPARAQTAFLFHRFKHMTYPAIARRMGISVSAVRQLMTRALTQIAQELDDEASGGGR